MPDMLEMSEMHHGIGSQAAESSALMEVFRRADIADVSLGIVCMGISKGLIFQRKRVFPKAGFHLRLLHLGGKRFISHPFNPLPRLCPSFISLWDSAHPACRSTRKYTPWSVWLSCREA